MPPPRVLETRRRAPKRTRLSSSIHNLRELVTQAVLELALTVLCISPGYKELGAKCVSISAINKANFATSGAGKNVFLGIFQNYRYICNEYMHFLNGN